MTTTPTTPTGYRIGERTVTMPVLVRDAAAGTVMFEVDAAAAAELLPGEAFRLVESAPGRAQVNLAVIDYRDNDLGDYDEVGVTLFVAPAGDDNDDRAGTFITHLPVNQQFTCDAGRGIWGFPKSVEDIALVYAQASTTTTLRMDGELVFRLTLPRGGQDDMPPMAMTTYTYIDGVPHATGFSQGGDGSQVVLGGDGVVLELGSHPMAQALRSLGLGADGGAAVPVLTTWTEHMQGRFDAPVPVG